MARPVGAGLGAAALLALLLWVEPAWCGGPWFYEQGTPDHGISAAGRAALGREASTAYGNPDGMTRLDSTQLMRLQASPNFIHGIGLNLGKRF